MTQKPSLDDLRIHRSDDAPSGSGKGLVIALIAIAVLGGGAFSVFRERPLEVTAASVREAKSGGGGAAVVLNATGYVTARRQATVSSKITGKVVEIHVEEGMRVASGQVLARLDDTTARKSLDLAASRLESSRRAVGETEALLKEASLNRERLARLVAEKIASSADLDVAAARADSLAARLEVARKDVEVSEREVALRRQDVDDAVIRAPFAGVAISKDAQPGEMISPVSGGGGYTRTGICTLVDMSSLEIEVDVSESYIQRVTTGARVEATLDAYPDWKIPASVITTVPAADRQKATMKVRIAFDALEPRILPDMGVKVAFLAPAGEGAAPARRLLVPKAAVRDDAGARVVYVFAGDKAERRAVGVGAAAGEDLEILSGLAAGERVIVEAPATLADGAKIRERTE